MKRKREESESDKDEHDDLATMDRQAIICERHKARRRLNAILEREMELDGRDLYIKASQIRERGWYQCLDTLVLPGGDTDLNAKTKPFLSEHLQSDACDIVCSYAMKTVAEACKELLDGMEIVKKNIDEKEEGFWLAITVGKIDMQAWHTEEPDPVGMIGPDIKTAINITANDKVCRSLRHVARELGVDGVIPLIILASILFYPIALACNEVENECGSAEERVGKRFRRWLSSSQERDAGVFYIQDEDEVPDPDKWHSSQGPLRDWILIKDKTLNVNMFELLCEFNMSQ